MVALVIWSEHLRISHWCSNCPLLLSYILVKFRLHFSCFLQIRLTLNLVDSLKHQWSLPIWSHWVFQRIMFILSPCSHEHIIVWHVRFCVQVINLFNTRMCQLLCAVPARFTSSSLVKWFASLFIIFYHIGMLALWLFGRSSGLILSIFASSLCIWVVLSRLWISKMCRFVFRLV